MVSPKIGKQHPTASWRRAVWSNTVAISRQHQQKLVSRKREKEEGDDDSKKQEDDRYVTPPKRRRKKSLIVTPGKIRKRRRPSKKRGDIEKTNKLVNFFRNTTPTQRLKFITACIIAGVKITSIVLVSLL